MEETSKTDASQNTQKKISLFMYNYHQCNPKKCSGMRLVRQGLVTEIKARFAGVLLSPYAKKTISPTDVTLAMRYGLAVVDCSWNEIKSDSVLSSRNARVLPPLVAANTLHYGQPFRLNCAEAIAAALYSMRFYTQAKEVLHSFNYGMTFLRLNKKMLNAVADGVLKSVDGKTKIDADEVNADNVNAGKVNSEEA